MMDSNYPNVPVEGVTNGRLGLLEMIICVIQTFFLLHSVQTHQIVQNTWNQIYRKRRLMLLNARRRWHLQMSSELLRQGFFIGAVAKNMCVFRRRKAKAHVNSTELWGKIASNLFAPEEWLEYFHMTQKSFQFVCSKLSSELKAQHSGSARLTIEKRIAIALYKLTTGNDYRFIANKFSVHKSTVHFCVYDVCKAINAILLPIYINIPSYFEAQQISQSFEKMTGFPQVLGVIGATHVPVVTPPEEYRYFVNNKGWPSVILQAVVDHRSMFRIVTCMHPGTCHESNVLKDCCFYKESDRAFPKMFRRIDGEDINLFLVGDNCYPLLKWLMTPYNDSSTVERQMFNTRIKSTTDIGEMTFKKLKGRFQCLLKLSDLESNFIPQVVSTCCVLHNIIESHGDDFNNEWMKAVDEAEATFPQPLKEKIETNFENYNEYADTIRQHLSKFLTKQINCN